MSRTRILAGVVVILLLAGHARSQERDLRKQYGTNSLEAAQHLKEALELLQAKKAKEALVEFDKAIKADDKLQLAYFNKAIALAELGTVDEAMETYKKCLSDSVRHSQNITAMAAVNLGLTLAKLKENDEANVWLTRGVLEDWNNGVKQRGKAYRNLAVSLKVQGKHLAAALALALAYQDKAPNCDIRMVMKYFDEAEGHEGARLLHFAEKVQTLPKRTVEAKLSEVTLSDGPSEAISDLLTDPQGRYVIALVAKADHFYVIATEDKPGVRKVTVSKPIVSACLAEGFLYVASNEPSKIEKIDVATGKVAATYSLKVPPPTTIAVYPTQGRAYFCGDDVVLEMDLKTGGIGKTTVPGNFVAGHPNQRYLYSYIKPERRGGGTGHVIINGRPVYFHRQFDWLQCTMFKSVVVHRGLLLAEVRDNAASNAARMSLSPDGNWVALAGGGGWRSTVKGQETGYGVAVFSAHNMEHLQGFFKTDAYPTGVCFNPVTGQVAAIRGADANVYHMSDSKTPVKLTGKFSGPGAWSGNGRYLVLAKSEGGGVAMYENPISREEQTLAAKWWKEIKAVPVVSAPIVTASFQAVDEYKSFALSEPGRDDLIKEFVKAAEKGRTDRPGPWNEYAPYIRDEYKKAIEDARPQIVGKTDLGIAIYQLNKVLKKLPDAVPVRFFLAEAQRLNNQADKAEENYLAVVKADCGRTDISWLSLNGLATIEAAKNKDLIALHCLAASLYLDRANPATLRAMQPILKKNKFDKEAEQVAKLLTGLSSVASTDLPNLPKPDEGKKLTAKEIYQKAVWSVVLIKTSKGSGSGVCVGKKDIIITNHHVVADGGDIEVYTYIIKDSAAVKMPVVKASIIFQSAKQDVAVLKLEKAPEHLEPMLVATANPAAGDKIYAIGSPGLGEEILEQSISQGLISGKVRKIEGEPYLQHSAAVNPGNSGGPVVDEKGRIVGIVTLKARLENVSFAIPAETIRAIFKSK
jgi:S1-C subfamily serine protease/Tfp pilus assembly protein PilF